MQWRYRRGRPSIWTTRTVGAPRAVIVGAEVDCLATERAAVVDEFLVFLDSHVEGSYGRREVGQVLTWWEGGGPHSRRVLERGLAG